MRTGEEGRRPDVFSLSWGRLHRHSVHAQGPATMKPVSQYVGWPCWKILPMSMMCQAVSVPKTTSSVLYTQRSGGGRVVGRERVRKIINKTSS